MSTEVISGSEASILGPSSEFASVDPGIVLGAAPTLNVSKIIDLITPVAETESSLTDTPVVELAQYIDIDTAPLHPDVDGTVSEIFVAAQTVTDIHKKTVAIVNRKTKKLVSDAMSAQLKTAESLAAARARLEQEATERHAQIEQEQITEMASTNRAQDGDIAGVDRRAQERTRIADEQNVRECQRIRDEIAKLMALLQATELAGKTTHALNEAQHQRDILDAKANKAGVLEQLKEEHREQLNEDESLKNTQLEEADTTARGALEAQEIAVANAEAEAEQRQAAVALQTQEERQEMQTQLERLAAARSELRGELGTKADLEQRLNGLRAELEVLQGEYDALKIEKDGTETAGISLQTQIAEVTDKLNKSYDVASAENRRIDAMEASYEKDLEDAERKLASAKSAVEALESAINDPLDSEFRNLVNNDNSQADSTDEVPPSDELEVTEGDTIDVVSGLGELLGRAGRIRDGEEILPDGELEESADVEDIEVTEESPIEESTSVPAKVTLEQEAALVEARTQYSVAEERLRVAGMILETIGGDLVRQRTAVGRDILQHRQRLTYLEGAAEKNREKFSDLNTRLAIKETQITAKESDISATTTDLHACERAIADHKAWIAEISDKIKAQLVRAEQGLQTAETMDEEVVASPPAPVEEARQQPNYSWIQGVGRLVTGRGRA